MAAISNRDGTLARRSAQIRLAILVVVSASADVSLAEEPRMLLRPAEPILSLAFSPDGTTLAAAGMDKTVRLWDVASGELKRTIVTHFKSAPGDKPQAAPVRRPYPAGLPPEIEAQIKQSAWEQIAAFNVRLPKIEAAEKAAGYIGMASAVKFSPDGNTVAALLEKDSHDGGETQVALYDVHGGSQFKTLTIPDWKQFVQDAAAKSRSTANRTGEMTQNANAGIGGAFPKPGAIQARQIDFSPDGRFVAGGCGAGVVVWSVSGGNRLEIPGADIGWFTFKPRLEKYESHRSWPLMTLDCWATLRTWDSKGGVDEEWETFMRGRRSYRGDYRPFASAASSPDGKVLALAGVDGSFALWNLQTVKPLKTIERPKGANKRMSPADAILDVAFTPDGKTIITEHCVHKDDSYQAVMRFRDAATGKVFGFLTTTGKGPNSSSGAGELRWIPFKYMSENLDQGQGSTYSLPARYIERFAVSPDGKQLAIALMCDDGDFAVLLWDFDHALAQARKNEEARQ